MKNVTYQIIQDLIKREETGLKKYGVLLHESKDDMLQHLYEELLDAAGYIKTLITQREEAELKAKDDKDEISENTDEIDWITIYASPL